MLKQWKTENIEEYIENIEDIHTYGVYIEQALFLIFTKACIFNYERKVSKEVRTKKDDITITHLGNSNGTSIFLLSEKL